jgi:nicotinamide riboside transporter PnuC
MDSQPQAAPPVEAAKGSAVAGTPRTVRWTSWVVVVSVGVPLLLVLAAGLEAIGNNTTTTGLGASILAAFVAGRAAGIHGARRWLVAWLLVFAIAGLLGLLLLPWDLPG